MAEAVGKKRRKHYFYCDKCKQETYIGRGRITTYRIVNGEKIKFEFCRPCHNYLESMRKGRKP